MVAQDGRAKVHSLSVHFGIRDQELELSQGLVSISDLLGGLVARRWVDDRDFLIDEVLWRRG